MFDRNMLSEVGRSFAEQGCRFLRSGDGHRFLAVLLLLVCVPALTWASSGPWKIEIVDDADGVGYYNAIAIDLSEKVHISYADWSANFDLVYATNASGAWTTEVVDDAWVGWYTSIAMDSSDKAHISYHDLDHYLKYATNASGAWITERLFSASSGEYTSIALDSTDKVHISSYSWWLGILQYTTNVTGAWQTETVDEPGFENFSGTSIAVDSSDKVHISYDSREFPENGLKYATNASGTWVTQLVDSAGYAGFHSSLALDSQGKVHISHIDVTTVPQLKYTTNASEAWVSQTLDYIGLINAPTSIAMDSNNKVHISYYVNGDLKYTTNSSGSWETETIDRERDVGWHSAIAVDALDRVHISYLDSTRKDLKYATNALLTPVPDIKANGSDGPLFIVPSENVDITISLNPGDIPGVMAEWWGLMKSSYNPSMWNPLFSFQWPLFDLPVTSLFDGPLPRGWYVFLFNVEDSPDSIFQLSWYDYVVVVVTPAEGAQAKVLPNFEALFQEKIKQLKKK